MKVYITKYPERDKWFTNLGNQLKRSKEKAPSRRKPKVSPCCQLQQAAKKVLISGKYTSDDDTQRQAD